MKLVVSSVFVLACSAVLATDPRPDPCAAWVLDGYRPNMSREDALAVHPATKETYLSWAVEEPGGLQGNLFFGFDDVDKLESYSSVHEAPPSAAEVISALKAKLGEPNLSVSPVKTLGGTGRATAWWSTTCEGVLSVVEERQTLSEDGVERTMVMVGLGGRAAIAGIEKHQREESETK